MAESIGVGVVGLGSMGYGMAQSLLRAGHGTHGFDVVPAQEARLRDEGGAAGRSPRWRAGSTPSSSSSSTPPRPRRCSSGRRARCRRCGRGAVVVACATVAPDFARAMEARCAEAGVLYLDAPISGGAARAAAGTLSVMASGTPAAFAAAEPVLAACAETVFRLGDAAGAGSAMKAVNQLLAGVHIAAMAEALTFGMTQGVTPAQFVEVISKCAGTSWMLENRAPHIVEGDYTPRSSVDIWPKDLGIVLDIAGKASSPPRSRRRRSSSSSPPRARGSGARTTRRLPRSTRATPG